MTTTENAGREMSPATRRRKIARAETLLAEVVALLDEVDAGRRRFITTPADDNLRMIVVQSASHAERALNTLKGRES